MCLINFINVMISWGKVHLWVSDSATCVSGQTAHDSGKFDFLVRGSGGK